MKKLLLILCLALQVSAVDQKFDTLKCNSSIISGGIDVGELKLLENYGVGDKYLNIRSGTNLSADRTLDFVTGDDSRVITLQADPTLGNWFDQSVKTDAEVTHKSLMFNNGTTDYWKLWLNGDKLSISPYNGANHIDIYSTTIWADGSLVCNTKLQTTNIEAQGTPGGTVWSTANYWIKSDSKGFQVGTSSPKWTIFNKVTTNDLIFKSTSGEVAKLTQAGGIKTSGGRICKTTKITSSPYNVLVTDHIVFVDSDGGAITVNLPAGVEGTNYNIKNTGSSGNDVTVDPNGTEQLFGAGAGVSYALTDGNVIDIHYNVTEGWF